MGYLDQFFVPLQNKQRGQAQPMFNGAPLDPTQNMPDLSYGSGLLPQGQGASPLAQFNGASQVAPSDPSAQVQMPPPQYTPQAPLISSLVRTPKKEIDHFDNADQEAEDAKLMGNYTAMPKRPTLQSMPVRDVSADGKEQGKAAAIAGLLGTIFGGLQGGVAASQGAVNGIAPAQDYRYQAEANRVGQQNNDVMQNYNLDRQGVSDANQMEGMRVGDARFLRQITDQEKNTQVQQEQQNLKTQLLLADGDRKVLDVLSRSRQKTLEMLPNLYDPTTGQPTSSLKSAIEGYNQIARAHNHPELEIQSDYNPGMKPIDVTRQQNSVTRSADESSKSKLRDAQVQKIGDLTPAQLAKYISDANLSDARAKAIPEGLDLRQQAMLIAAGRAKVAEEMAQWKKENPRGVTPQQADSIAKEAARYAAPNGVRSAQINKYDPFYKYRGLDGTVPVDANGIPVSRPAMQQDKSIGAKTLEDLKAKVFDANQKPRVKDPVTGRWLSQDAFNSIAPEDDVIRSRAQRIGLVEQSPLQFAQAQGNTPPSKSPVKYNQGASANGGDNGAIAAAVAKALSFNNGPTTPYVPPSVKLPANLRASGGNNVMGESAAPKPKAPAPSPISKFNLDTVTPAQLNSLSPAMQSQVLAKMTPTQRKQLKQRMTPTPIPGVSDYSSLFGK